MSIDPTANPSVSKATITCMATVDLPDPPFSLPTTMTYGCALILSPDRCPRRSPGEPGRPNSPGRSISMARAAHGLHSGSHPDRRIVEDRTAAGLAWVGAGQGVDAKPAREIRVGPN